MTDARGQATVEALSFLPLLGLLALIAFTFIASHTAGEQAGEAAEAGALMLLQGGGDPREAAEQALPKKLRQHADIHIAGHQVTVRVVPNLPLPGVASLLAHEAHANAGP